MLGKINSMKKLVKKVKTRKEEEEVRVHLRYVGLNDEDVDHDECINLEEPQPHHSSSPPTPNSMSTPTGFLAIYVGEERARFVVPTSHLSHPLFKMLLEKAEHEFGFEQRQGLVVPCTVAVFQQVLNAIETCHGRFDFGNMVQEFI